MCLQNPSSNFRALLLMLTLPLAIVLSGCAMTNGAGSIPSTHSPARPGVFLEGKAYGGQQPVVGATLQLYAAGAPTSGGGYGQGAKALIPAASQPITDVNGSFTITGLYTCPATPAVSQVYLVATGGSPGPGVGVNPSIAMMAAIGSCTAGSTLNPNLNIWINEVTTVASVWALQQFMAAPSAATTGAPSIGAPGNTYNGVQSAVVGLQNSFAMVNNMVNITNGSATPLNAWSTPDNNGANIYTLADIVATCVNSTVASGACSTLFTDATPSGSFQAADTIQAAWYIAQNPAHNVSTLFKLVPPTPPFVGVSATPNDFTLAVNLAPTYTPASTALYAVNTPHHVAIDKYGNAWLSNNGGISNTVAAPAGVTELAPNGNVLMNPVSSFTASVSGGAYSQFTTVPSSTTVNYSKPKMVAIDTNNNAWVANYGTTSGTPAAGTIGFLSGSTAAGVAGGITNTGYYVGGAPWGLAIDGHNNVYESNTTTTGLDPLSMGRLAATTAGYTYSTAGGNTAPNKIPNLTIPAGTNGSSITFPAVLAVDANTTASGGADGLLWLASASCYAVSSQYDDTAAVPWGVVDIFAADTVSAVAGAEATTSFSGATTGAGSSTNCGNSTVPGTGLQIGQIFSAAMSNPYGVAIDRYNGVWISDVYYSSSGAYNAQGFNGLTYLTAPTANTGVIPSSTYITNGPALASTTTPSQGQVQRETLYIQVDGNNNLWGANASFGTIVEASYTPAVPNTSPGTINYLTPASVGFVHTLDTASGLAIDSSGNVWVTNTSSSAKYTGQANGPATPYGGASVTVLVGAAAPVVTPLAQAVASNMLGQKP